MFPLYLSLFHFLVKWSEYFKNATQIAIWWKVLIQAILLFLHLTVSYTLCLASILPFMPNYVIMHCNYLIDCPFPLGSCSLHKLETVFHMLRTMLKLDLWDNTISLSIINKKWGSSFLIRHRRFSYVESSTLFTTFKHLLKVIERMWQPFYPGDLPRQSEAPHPPLSLECAFHLLLHARTQPWDSNMLLRP